MEKMDHVIASVTVNPQFTRVLCSCGVASDSIVVYMAVRAVQNHCDSFNASDRSEISGAVVSLASSAIADAVSMGINIGCGADVDTLTTSVVKSYKSKHALMSAIEGIVDNV